MGKIIGDKKKIAITFTQEEVKKITSDLNLKVVELTSKVEKEKPEKGKKANEE